MKCDVEELRPKLEARKLKSPRMDPLHHLDFKQLLAL